MKKVHAKRLLKLADFLDTVPPKRFSYRTYVGRGWDGKTKFDSPACGTTACALGWAAVMPEFRRLGLRLQDDPYCDGLFCVRSKTGDYPEAASKEIFGLTLEQHMDIFIPSGPGYEGGGPSPDATPKQVAKHIRKCVAKWTAAAT